MITNVLLEHRWLAPTALVVLVVLGPPLGAWAAARTRAAWGLTGLALVPVALTTLVPVDRELFERCTVQWAAPTPSRVELFANLVLFVAPVLFAAVALRRPLVALAAGAGLSVAIEALQAAVPAIGRSCDTGDWLSNALGAAVGAGLGWAALSLARRGVVRWRASTTPR